MSSRVAGVDTVERHGDVQLLQFPMLQLHRRPAQLVFVGVHVARSTGRQPLEYVCCLCHNVIMLHIPGYAQHDVATDILQLVILDHLLARDGVHGRFGAGDIASQRLVRPDGGV